MDAIEGLDPQEADLISDRAVEILLRDDRRIRISAAENLLPNRSVGFDAIHELAVDMPYTGGFLRCWGSVNLPRATGRTAADCLASAIRLLVR